MIVAVSQPPIPPTAPNDGFRDFLPAPPADSSSLTCPHGPLPHQRPAVTRRILGVWHFRHFRLWMCVVSRDIGMHDSCVFGCRDCYATRDFTQARVNLEKHDPSSPSLLGWHEPPTEATTTTIRRCDKSAKATVDA